MNRISPQSNHSSSKLVENNLEDFMQPRSYEFTLQQFISQKSKDALDDTQKLIILYGIAKGMSFVHKKGCVHRDLKPANILLDANKYPVICDFGLAKFVNSPEQTETTEGRRKGTIYYMAPEQQLVSNSKSKS